MATKERREQKRKGRSKVFSYRIKWRYCGTGSWQSVTVKHEVDADALKRAIEEGGHAFLSSDESGLMTGSMVNFDQSVWGAYDMPPQPLAAL